MDEVHAQVRSRDANQASKSFCVGDESLVALARLGDTAALELLMRRYNRRAYRIVRSALRDDTEVERVMQQAYLSAFDHLEHSPDDARWSTLLCRSAIEATVAWRQQPGHRGFDAARENARPVTRPESPRAPRRITSERALRRVVERELDEMPESLRAVMMMREIEGMTTAETAAALNVADDVVRTRLHLVREWLLDRTEAPLAGELSAAFAFDNQRCDRVVVSVLARWGERRLVRVTGHG